MPWQIKDMNKDGKVIEEWNCPERAQRAMLILSAHEISMGRKANFIIEPPVDLDPNWDKNLGLPDWVIEVLEKA